MLLDKSIKNESPHSILLFLLFLEKMTSNIDAPSFYIIYLKFRVLDLIIVFLCGFVTINHRR